MEKFINQKEISKSDNSEGDDKIDKIFNSFGKFQIRALILLSPAYFYVGMVLIAIMFFNIIPDHECKHNSSYHACSFTDKNTSLFENVCNVTKEKYCFRYKYFNDTSVNNSNFLTNLHKENCFDGWIYSSTYGITVVSQFDLICDSAWKRPLIISSLMAGTMLGSPLGGRLADRFGRKTICLTTCLGHAVCLVILSFSPNYWFFLCFIFISGVLHVLIYNSSFIWVQELVSDESKRTLAAFCLNALFGLGVMLMSLVAYLTPNWFWMCRVVAVIGAICALMLSFVSESPKWLLQSRKPKKAAKILKHIAQLNKVDDLKLDDLLQNIQRSKEKANLSNDESAAVISLTVLFRNPIFLQRILVICFLWNCGYLGYFTSAYNTPNLGGNVYINNLIGGGLDIGAAAFISIMLKKFSRKNSQVFLTGASAFFLIATPLTRQVSYIFGTVFAMIGRFFAQSGCLLTILYTGEIFPTLLRNTSVGLASMSARITNILGPFLIFLGEEVDFSIPFYVMGGAFFLGAALTLLLPETSKGQLPDTIAEALKLKQNTFSVIIRRKGKSHRDKEIPTSISA